MRTTRRPAGSPGRRSVRVGLAGRSMTGSIPDAARLKQLLPVYGLLLPGLILFATWALIPLLHSFVMSFTDWRVRGGSAFIGLDNYVRAMHDPLFWRALSTTAGYTAVTVAGQMVLGLGAALLLDQRIPGRSLLRLVYYLPVITSWVIVSLVLVWLYNGQTGVLNWLLRDALGVIDRNVAWLAEPSTAIWAIAVLGIWKGIGWSMVVFLAGLQSVAPELHEAAAIDGAGRAARFRHVTLPALLPTTTFLLIVLTIGGFSTFISVFVMSSAATGVVGGPLNSTDVALTYMYKQAFAEIDLGYGAALSFILAGIIGLVSLVELRFARRQGLA